MSNGTTVNQVLVSGMLGCWDYMLSLRASSKAWRSWYKITFLHYGLLFSSPHLNPYPTLQEFGGVMKGKETDLANPLSYFLSSRLH